MSPPAAIEPVRFQEPLSLTPRIMGFRTLALSIALLATLAQGPASAEPAASVIGVGDILQVTVFAGGEKQEEFTATVAPAGTITCPLLGEVRVAGLNTDEISRQLRARLAADYFVDPQVQVSVKEYGGQIFVTGEVKQPGAYAAKDGLTVLHACLLAGGFTDFASLRHVKLTRVVGGQPKTTIVDLQMVKQGKRPDLPVASGDRLDVPRRRF